MAVKIVQNDLHNFEVYDTELIKYIIFTFEELT